MSKSTLIIENSRPCIQLWAAAIQPKNHFPRFICEGRVEKVKEYDNLFLHYTPFLGNYPAIFEDYRQAQKLAKRWNACPATIEERNSVYKLPPAKPVRVKLTLA